MDPVLRLILTALISEKVMQIEKGYIYVIEGVMGCFPVTYLCKYKFDSFV